MVRFVIDLEEVDRSHVAEVGGKGANLGELSHIDGIDVPPGFCVTTDAFRQMIAAGDGSIVMPGDVATEIERAVARFGGDRAYAVRSSATTEDSITASFAGQHDSYLNVMGADSVVEHVRRCWDCLLYFSDVV